jgi:hypothetical protein
MPMQRLAAHISVKFGANSVHRILEPAMRNRLEKRI